MNLLDYARQVGAQVIEMPSVYGGWEPITSVPDSPQQEQAVTYEEETGMSFKDAIELAHPLAQDDAWQADMPTWAETGVKPSADVMLDLLERQYPTGSTRYATTDPSRPAATNADRLAERWERDHPSGGGGGWR